MIWNSLFSNRNFTIQAYKTTYKDIRFWKIFGKTSFIGIVSAMLTTLIGLTVAFFLEKVILPFKTLFKIVYIIPLILPPYFIALGWTNLLNLLPGDFNLYNIVGVVFIMTLSYFPLVTLILIAGFRNIDYRLEEAAKLFTNRLKYFLKITLPLLRPYILISLMIVFILTFGEYAMPELLRVDVFAMETLIQFSIFYNFKKATVTCIPVLFITIALIFIMSKIMSNRPYITIGGKYKSGKPEKLGKITTAGFLFISILIFLSVICPIGSLIIKTGNLGSYILAFNSSISEILYSLFLSFTGATICTILCLIMAYGAEKSKGILKQSLNFLTLIPFAIPTTVVGIGLIKLWNKPTTSILYSSSYSILIGYLICFNPYGIRIISSSIKSINKKIQQSASFVDVPKLTSFFKINFPLLSPFLIITWIVMFIFCIKEIPLTLLIIPAGKSTLLTKIESTLHIGTQQYLSSLCLVYISIVFLILLLFLPYTKLKDI